MAFWLKSLLCAGIFFSTAFDRGCFNITKWKTNEYVLLSEPKDWLCSVVTVPYVTALFTPAVKLNIFRVITFCLCEYLCVLSVFWRKKSPKKLFHNNIASLEGTVEVWYLGHWYLEYSEVFKQSQFDCIYIKILPCSYNILSVNWFLPSYGNVYVLPNFL